MVALGLAHRWSSLSRPPQRRLGADPLNHPTAGSGHPGRQLFAGQRRGRAMDGDDVAGVFVVRRAVPRREAVDRLEPGGIERRVDVRERGDRAAAGQVGVVEPEAADQQPARRRAVPARRSAALARVSGSSSGMVLPATSTTSKSSPVSSSARSPTRQSRSRRLLAGLHQHARRRGPRPRRRSRARPAGSRPGRCRSPRRAPAPAGRPGRSRTSPRRARRRRGRPSRGTARRTARRSRAPPSRGRSAASGSSIQ